MKTILKLKKGDRVEKLGPFKTIGIVGTVVGYHLKGIADGQECYWVTWDGHSKKTREAYHANFLKRIDNNT